MPDSHQKLTWSKTDTQEWTLCRGDKALLFIHREKPTNMMFETVPGAPWRWTGIDANGDSFEIPDGLTVPKAKKLAEERVPKPSLMNAIREHLIERYSATAQPVDEPRPRRPSAHWSTLFISTPLGRLLITPRDGWIHMRFLEPDRAKHHLGFLLGGGPSGKYNLNLPSLASVDECISQLDRHLAPVISAKPRFWIDAEPTQPWPQERTWVAVIDEDEVVAYVANADIAETLVRALASK